MKRAGNKIMGNDSKVNYLHDILWEWKINYFLQLPGTLSGSKLKKQKNLPPKKFLIFQEMELSSSIIREVLIFLKMRTCIFQSQPSKFFSKKISYIFS